VNIPGHVAGLNGGNRVTQPTIRGQAKEGAVDVEDRGKGTLGISSLCSRLCAAKKISMRVTRF